MFTLYFILSHLFGDFLLQPSWLYKMKIRSHKGIALHAAVCAIAIPLFLFPYINAPALWGITLLTGLTHFVFDTTKIAHEKKQNSFSLSPFIIDQIGHLSVALLCGFAITGARLEPWLPLTGWFGEAYKNGSFALLISALILVSYVVDIVRYQIVRTQNARAEYKRDYPGMLKRTLSFAIFTLVVVIYVLAMENGFKPEMIGLSLQI